MKFYLSSYKIGNKGDILARMISDTKKSIGYIPNARDFTKADPTRRAEAMTRDLEELKNLNIATEMLDLRMFFGKNEALESRIDSLGGLYISGGNTFVLRQAMKITGLDVLLRGKLKDRIDFVYAGYSAAGCVLASDLSCYKIVDDPLDKPYKECVETIWEGLGLVDWAFMPHFQSDHSESADIDKEIELCKQRNMQYKPLRDGDVLIME